MHWFASQPSFRVYHQKELHNEFARYIIWTIDYVGRCAWKVRECIEGDGSKFWPIGRGCGVSWTSIVGLWCRQANLIHKLTPVEARAVPGCSSDGSSCQTTINWPIESGHLCQCRNCVNRLPVQWPSCSCEFRPCAGWVLTVQIVSRQLGEISWIPFDERSRETSSCRSHKRGMICLKMHDKKQIVSSWIDEFNKPENRNRLEPIPPSKYPRTKTYQPSDGNSNNTDWRSLYSAKAKPQIHLTLDWIEIAITEGPTANECVWFQLPDGWITVKIDA
jgi:hypothetical protein